MFEQYGRGVIRDRYGRGVLQGPAQPVRVPSVVHDFTDIPSAPPVACQVFSTGRPNVPKSYERPIYRVPGNIATGASVAGGMGPDSLSRTTSAQELSTGRYARERRRVSKTYPQRRLHRQKPRWGPIDLFPNLKFFLTRR